MPAPSNTAQVLGSVSKSGQTWSLILDSNASDQVLYVYNSATSATNGYLGFFGTDGSWNVGSASYGPAGVSMTGSGSISTESLSVTGPSIFTAANASTLPVEIVGTAGQTADLLSVLLTAGGTKTLWTASDGVLHTTLAPVLGAPLAIASGGTGTVTPGLVPGTDITLSGAWPNQTIGLTNSTISGVALGANLHTLTFGSHMTGSSYNGSADITIATDAASSNAASALVTRDSSGNFSAGTITAALSGNASTATALQTARTFNGTSFDGTANITVVVNSADDTTTNTTYYPLFTTATGGNNAAKTASSKLTFNPSTGTLGATIFSGSGASLTSIPNGALTNSTISGIALGSNLATLTFGTHITGTSYNGSAAATIATDADTANTVSTLVARDGSGNFAAGTITATLSGNATTATTLATARAINGTNFNGSAAITVVVNSADDTTTNTTYYPLFTIATGGNNAAKTSSSKFTFNPSTGVLVATTFSGSGASLTSIPNGALSNSTISGIALGSNLATLTFGTHLTGSAYNGSGTVTIATDAASANTVSTLVARDGSGNFSAGTITATLSGNASTATTATTATSATTATTLATARAINGTNFDGSAAINLPVNSADDTTTNATYYPLFTTATGGNNAAKTSSSKFTFNPSTGALTLAGNITAPGFFISSLRKLKKDIAPLNFDALATIQQTDIVRFRYKAGDQCERLGIIADESPMSLTGTGQYFDTARALAVALQAIKQLASRLESLEYASR